MATRAGTYPREQAREIERRSLRRNRWRLARMSLIPLAGSLIVAVLWPQLSVPLWALPVLLWSVLLGAAWSQLHGSYAVQMGAEAEVWSSEELSKLERIGARHFDHVVFERLDIDHVLVHPGGVFVLETKYTDRQVDLAGRGTERMLGDWRHHALRGARKIRSFLVTSKRFTVDITPVVVVWGGEIEGSRTERDGVVIVRGAALVEAIESLASLPKLDLRKQEAICEALQGFIDKRDASLR